MRLTSLNEVARRSGCELVSREKGMRAEEIRVGAVTVDSRRLTPPNALFFALAGQHTDGHGFVADALAAGCVAAVVDARRAGELTGVRGPLLLAPATEPRDADGGGSEGEDNRADGGDPVLAALVRLATWWRGQLKARVLGITGSNGKTTVKSALHAVLARAVRTAVSPGSYNSRLGVALSLLGMDSGAEVALVEAGVSEPGNMAPLEAMIRPDLGLVTGLGTAHIGRFTTRKRIGVEKLQLFGNIAKRSGRDPGHDPGWVLIPDDPVCRDLARDLRCDVHVFGQDNATANTVGVQRLSTTWRLSQVVLLTFPDGDRFDIEVRDTSGAQVQNVAATASAALLLGLAPADIAGALDGFRPPPQRLETWQSPDGVTIINDCYSADPTSTDAALRALGEYPANARKVFVFGGMAGLGDQAEQEHRHAGGLAAEVGVDVLAAVGHRAEATARAFDEANSGELLRFADPAQAAGHLSRVLRHGDVVLVKGPTDLRMNGLARALVESSAPTRLIIDLTTVEANLRQLRRHVSTGVKLCPIVKAAAYGGDPVRLCRFLERIGVDYLGVAFTDEGVALRKAGISLPVLVLSPGRGEERLLVNHMLTPVLHSVEGLEALEEAASRVDSPQRVHLEVDTGMGRYGLFPDEVLAVARRIHGSTRLELEGVMTHFAAAEDPAEDDFTRSQIAQFNRVLASLEAEGIPVAIRHAAATAAALRFDEARFDMVRVGLGLYGVLPSESCRQSLSLECAVAAVSRISSIKTFPRGHTLGYGRRYRVTAATERIAFIPCGYHDAVWRDLYRGGGEVLVRGVRCPIVGTVSMDSAPINISAVPDADIGDDVLLFGQWQGQILPPEEVAERANTVTHQLLSGVGPRVQRIYQEG
jgi:Alr-MurF fusion protein